MRFIDITRKYWSVTMVMQKSMAVVGTVLPDERAAQSAAAAIMERSSNAISVSICRTSYLHKPERLVSHWARLDTDSPWVLVTGKE